MYTKAYIDCIDLLILSYYDKILCLNKTGEYIIATKQKCRNMKQLITKLKTDGCIHFKDNCVLLVKLDQESINLLHTWGHGLDHNRKQITYKNSPVFAMSGGNENENENENENGKMYLNPNMKMITLEYQPQPVFKNTAEKLEEQGVIAYIPKMDKVIDTLILLCDLMIPVVTTAAGVVAIIGTLGGGGDIIVKSVTSTVNTGLFATKIARAAIVMAENSSYLEQLLMISFKTDTEDQDDDQGPLQVRAEAMVIIEQMIRDGNESLIDEITRILMRLLDSVVTVTGQWISTFIPDEAGVIGHLIRGIVNITARKGASEAFNKCTWAFNKIPKQFRKFLKDGDALKVFLNDVLQFLKEAVKRIREGGPTNDEMTLSATFGRIHDKILTQVVPGLQVTEKISLQLGIDKILTKLIDEQFAPNIDNAVAVVMQVVPLTFVILVFAQISADPTTLDPIRNKIKQESTQQPQTRTYVQPQPVQPQPRMYVQPQTVQPQPRMYVQPQPVQPQPRMYVQPQTVQPQPRMYIQPAQPQPIQRTYRNQYGGNNHESNREKNHDRMNYCLSQYINYLLTIK